MEELPLITRALWEFRRINELKNERDAMIKMRCSRIIHFGNRLKVGVNKEKNSPSSLPPLKNSMDFFYVSNSEKVYSALVRESDAIINHNEN
jgi:hypothetical protein